MSQTASNTPSQWTAGALAERLGLRVAGDPARAIDSAATLSSAGPRQLAFLANPAYRKQLPATRAGAVILSSAAVGDCPATALVADQPYLAWARALELIHPEPPVRTGIDASARIAEDADIDPASEIGPFCVIGPGARICADVRLGPQVCIGAGAVIGDGSHLAGQVWVGAGCRLGKRVRVHPGAVIGADGFGLAMDGARGGWRKVPQIGAVTIGDDCEIGANTTIDRGAVEDTVLGVDVRLDNQVQVAHNVVIGDHTAIAGCVGIAGSTRIGRRCMIAGASGIGGHLDICDDVVITAMSTVLDSIPAPGHYGSGIPARPLRRWQRILVRLGQLETLFRRID